MFSIRILLSGCLLFALPVAGQNRNILLIIADDMGIDSHALYNSSENADLPPTPNIDALKATGVQFLNAYAQPTCSPTRASMMTGRQAFRTGVTTAVSANDGQMMAGEFTLPKAFQVNDSLGYSLADFGKWHLTIGNYMSNDPANVGGWPHFSGSLNGGLTGGNGGTGTYTSWAKTVDAVTGPTNGQALPTLRPIPPMTPSHGSMPEDQIRGLLGWRTTPRTRLFTNHHPTFTHTIPKFPVGTPCR